MRYPHRMAKKRRVTKKALQQARETALAGNADEAIVELGWMVEAGSVAAAASLAELLAFQGDWRGVVDHAARLIAEPSAVYAGNVFDDMVCLLGLAGHGGAAWTAVSQAAKRATARLQAEEERQHIRNRLGPILKNLASYARRQGKPPHELIRIFGVTPSKPDPDAYRDACDAVLTLRPKLKGKPDELARHLFALAVTFKQPEAIVERFDERPNAMDFFHAVEAARCLVEREEHERAWEIIEPRISSWWPVDAAQVAPVILLTDPRLRQLCSEERKSIVLATPRGPMAHA